MRNFMFALVFLGMSLCTNGGEYFIEISPSAGQGYYEMKIGDIVTFEIAAYKRTDNSNTLVDLEEKVWWEYNKRVFEKISSDKKSISLKAIREGIAQLNATTIIKNNHCQKKIDIIVIK